MKTKDGKISHNNCKINKQYTIPIRKKERISTYIGGWNVTNFSAFYHC